MNQHYELTFRAAIMSLCNIIPNVLLPLHVQYEGHIYMQYVIYFQTSLCILRMRPDSVQGIPQSYN